MRDRGAPATLGGRAPDAAGRGREVDSYMHRLLYVVGTGFSGSTLFAFLVDGHPQIATVGEATGPMLGWEDHRSYVCSCGEKLPDCPFWRRVSEEMASRGFDFGPNRWDMRFMLFSQRAAHQLTIQSLRAQLLDDARDAMVAFIPPWSRHLREVARRNEAFVDAVLAVTGKRVFLDASKDAARARLLLRHSNLDVHVIFLVRDAPGQVSSFMKNQNSSLGAAVRYWNRTAGHARRIARRLPPDRFLVVRYEDLCERTEEEIGRVARFAGLEPAPGPVDFRSGDHHIIGNRMRMASSGEIVLDQRWRERLSREELDRILRRTAANRRRLGYA